MPLATISGQAVTHYVFDTYDVVESAGTLPSTEQNFVAKNAVDGPGFPLVVYCHGAFVNETEMTDPGPIDTITTYLASVGFSCIAVDVGSLFGHDHGRARISEGITAGQANLVAAPGSVILIGTSLGSTNMWSWISDDHMSDTLCAIGFAPVVDSQALYDNGEGWDVLFDITWASQGGWPANQPAYDPIVLATAGVFNGLRYKAFYGGSDVTVPPETQEAMIAAIGVTASGLEFPPAGHAEVLPTINPYHVAEFMAECTPTASSLRRVIMV
jgi:hypothetical protein